jgi:hypothetical protein
MLDSADAPRWTLQTQSGYGFKAEAHSCWSRDHSQLMRSSMEICRTSRDCVRSRATCPEIGDWSRVAALDLVDVVYDLDLDSSWRTTLVDWFKKASAEYSISTGKGFRGLISALPEAIRASNRLQDGSSSWLDTIWEVQLELPVLSSYENLLASYHHVPLHFQLGTLGGQPNLFLSPREIQDLWIEVIGDLKEPRAAPELLEQLLDRLFYHIRIRVSSRLALSHSRFVGSTTRDEVLAHAIITGNPPPCDSQACDLNHRWEYQGIQTEWGPDEKVCGQQVVGGLY